MLWKNGNNYSDIHSYWVCEFSSVSPSFEQLQVILDSYFISHNSVHKMRFPVSGFCFSRDVESFVLGICVYAMLHSNVLCGFY